MTSVKEAILPVSARGRGEGVEQRLPYDRQNKILGYHPLDFFYSNKTDVNVTLKLEPETL